MADESPCKGNILIVDDDPLIVELLVDKIRAGHYRISTADSGAACLQALQKRSTDLILLDIMMPEMNGYEVCRQIKSNPETADIPILFITALTDSHDKMKGF